MTYHRPTLTAWNNANKAAREDYAAHPIAFNGPGTCRQCAGPTTAKGGCVPCKQAKHRERKAA